MSSYQVRDAEERDLEQLSVSMDSYPRVTSPACRLTLRFLG